MSLRFRLAEDCDLWPMMSLYQRFGSTYTEDALFLDMAKLSLAIRADESLWLVGITGEELKVVVSVFIDRDQGVVRISRLMVSPEEERALEFLRRGLSHLISYLQEHEPSIDVLYSTTMSIPLQFQKVTLEENFKIMGVFPGALGKDSSHLNGITVYYMPRVLETKRSLQLNLHPVLQPFFRIAQSQLNLPEPDWSETAYEPDRTSFEELPPLESIDAPRLVHRRFEKIRANQSMNLNFYPFFKPNKLICDPDEQVEVFVRTSVNARFAAIIAEHVQISLDPIQLYQTVLGILRQENISYIEIINDAEDTYGNACIMEAAFTPCAYLPAFKRHSLQRRDYVVFGRSFEYLCKPHMDVPKPYLDFFRAYYRLERRNYFGNRYFEN